MACKALTRSDGSRWCAECGVSWDHDEDEEDCCPKLREAKKDAEQDRADAKR